MDQADLEAFMGDLPTPRLDLDQFEALEDKIMEGEVSQLNNDKTPSPNGFPVKFYKCVTLKVKYFPEDEVEPIKWVRDPFNAEIPQHFNNEEAEPLIDISSHSTLKVQFQSLSLLEFWCQTQDEYPVISKIALRVLIPFATSHLCEAGFSAVAMKK
ncbi:hypothetical protein NDU88_003573 [Pleurodeles waltl]|uniref:HAT C-terminal dimerisation domain-containing protein n=1 Tax=Pleurodeles waltl TaxID=8319 RepID=A0AAV7QAF4_PLEWA|nr:hypothetical protein NDU88_003573 [Pleurodeles waltl]